MGCGSSIDNVEYSPRSRKKNSEDDDEDSEDRLQRRFSEDVGMTTKSHADLLDAQRLRSTDVTRGLEDRWIRSHFSKQELSVGELKARRRKLSCRSGELSRHVSPKSSGAESWEVAIEASLLESGQSFGRYNDNEVKDSLCILHFNDVYEISERPTEPIGGAARFSSLIKSKIEEAIEATEERPLVIFGGDCLNPSTLSCATLGRHMIEVLNNLSVDVAVFGNHEFDFGVEHAVKCTQEMSSKWLLGNVTDKLTSRNLAEGESKHMINRKNGLKIGVVGLVEEEWLDTLATVDKANLEYHDYVDRGRELAKELRKEGADFVIAVTHMRWPNDIRLAREVPDIDLILGGHDHDYGVKEIEECLIIKSGSDFRSLSSIEIFLRQDGCVDVKLVRHDITDEIPIDPEMGDIVHRYMSTLEKSLEERIGRIETDLDGRFEKIRSQETTLGNFVADIMATVTKADIVLINSGTFRSDAIHYHGDFSLHDLMTILPINDTVVTIIVTGQQLLAALENGVSKFPKLEGRFPQISRMCFGFNPDADPGKRVIKDTIFIGGKPLDLTAQYKMATKAYVARGKDGYTCLTECKILTDPDSGPLLSTVVRNHILNVKCLLDFERDKCCKVCIGADGRSISCDSVDIDATEAFQKKYKEPPIDTIQNSMRPVIHTNGNNNTITREEQPSSNCSQNQDGVSKTMHIPNFITIDPDAVRTSSEGDIAKKVARLRIAAQSANEENKELLSARSQTPFELKWQISPLLEARIFNCTDLCS